MEIKDKIAIVTGASAGIGLALARLLAEKGATVILAARSADKLKQLEQQIPGRLPIRTDMQKPENTSQPDQPGARQVFRPRRHPCEQRWPGPSLPVETINLDEYRAIMELNVFAVVSAMQEVIPIMRKQGGGRIRMSAPWSQKTIFQISLPTPPQNTR